MIIDLEQLDVVSLYLCHDVTKERGELQKTQNGCMRTCLSYSRIGHVSIQRLHNEIVLISLEQLRQIQCLRLMYILSA